MVAWQNAPNPSTPLDAATLDAAFAETLADAAALIATQHTADDATYGTLAQVATKVTKGELVLNVRDFGAVGDGTTDDTAAIQAAITAATPGSTILFPPTGSGAWYRITASLLITTPNLRFLGGSRDGYGVSIRCATPSVVMFTVKAPSCIFEDIGIFGDSAATNGVGATTVGIALYGDINANVDVWIRRTTLQGHALGINQMGRNGTIENNTITNCLAGVLLNGIDWNGTTGYHFGPSAASNRGNRVEHNRFHNIGNSSTDIALSVSTTAKVQHARITDNYFDSNGYGRHIVATGTVTDPHKRLTIANNKHTDTNADVVVLNYVNESRLTGFDMASDTGVSGNYGRGIVMTNCDGVEVSGQMLQMGQTGLLMRSSTRIQVHHLNYRGGGIDPGTVAHAIDADSTVTESRFDFVTANVTDGWGFIGEPTTCAMTECDFRSCILGTINSLTVVNHRTLGLNRFIEGGFGRHEDTGRKSFDFLAATAKQVATVFGGGSYSSFIVDVEFTAANIGFDCYARATYAVRTESGAPVVTTLGTANVARVAITTAASGLSGVTFSLNCTGASSGNVVVRARAGGAANTSNPRGVTVTML